MFVLWQAQMRGGLRKEYIGLESNVEQVHHHLERIFPYFFDEKRHSIVNKGWLRNWFHPNPCDPQYRDGEFKVLCNGDNIVITDEGEAVYDRLGSVNN